MYGLVTALGWESAQEVMGLSVDWEEAMVVHQRGMMLNLWPIPHALHMNEAISTRRMTNNCGRHIFTG